MISKNLTFLCRKYNISLALLMKMASELQIPEDEGLEAKDFWGKLAGTVKKAMRRKIF